MGNQVQSGGTGDPSRNEKYEYCTDNGGNVRIGQLLDPYLHLGVTKNTKIPEIKAAFKAKVVSLDRQIRATASLAYYMITSRSRDCFRETDTGQFALTNEDIFLLCAIGYTAKVIKLITQDEDLIRACNEHKHTPLYLAARSGFYDLTRILISRGSSMINHQQVDGSTALHGAAFYGQNEIVKLLLEHGATPNAKNKWHHTPLDEAANDEIKHTFHMYHSDLIPRFQSSLKSENIYQRARPVFYGNDIIAMEIIVKEDTPDDSWEMAWHGTKYDNLVSIVQYGLKPSGSSLPNGKKLVPHKGHYKLGVEYEGVKDWARAVFVSPSLRYGAHAAYAERIFSDKIRWCVLVKVFFHKSLQYSKYEQTTLRKHSFLAGEPDAPEYRIPTTEDDVIVRIEESRNFDDDLGDNLIVKSVVFIKVDFLDNINKLKPQFCHNDIKCLFS